MGIAGSIAVFVLTLLGAVLTQIIADELKAWSPPLSKLLLELAVRHLPLGQRPRFSEEWASHLDQTPGHIVKLITAAGFVIAAFNLNRANHLEIKLRIRQRRNDTLMETALNNWKGIEANWLLPTQIEPVTFLTPEEIEGLLRLHRKLKEQRNSDV